jgi:hypothetical protein
MNVSGMAAASTLRSRWQFTAPVAPLERRPVFRRCRGPSALTNKKRPGPRTPGSLLKPSLNPTWVAFREGETGEVGCCFPLAQALAIIRKDLQGLEECDKSSAIVRGQVQSERMSLNGIGLHPVGFKSGGHVVISQTAWIKPVLQRRTPAAVAKHPPIPDTAQRWDFIIAGPTSGLQREVRFSADGERQNVVFLCASAP